MVLPSLHTIEHGGDLGGCIIRAAPCLLIMLPINYWRSIEHYEWATDPNTFYLFTRLCGSMVDGLVKFPLNPLAFEGLTQEQVSMSIARLKSSRVIGITPIGIKLDPQLINRFKGGGPSNAVSRYPDPPLFRKFWDNYPALGRTSIISAREAWERLNPSKELTELWIKKVNQQAKSDNWQAGFIPSITRWLTEGRWEDSAESWHDRLKSELEKMEAMK